MIVWQNRMFRRCLAGRPYPRATRETQLSPFVLTLRIPVMCRVYASLRGMLTRELPMKTLQSSMPWVFTHSLSLSHTTLTNKSHMKYRVQKIEQNYNQIWQGIKANKNIVLNYNYNLPLWLFRDKTPKTNSKLKCEFENSGKTHSHLI